MDENYDEAMNAIDKARALVSQASVENLSGCRQFAIGNLRRAIAQVSLASKAIYEEMFENVETDLHDEGWREAVLSGDTEDGLETWAALNCS